MVFYDECKYQWIYTKCLWFYISTFNFQLLTFIFQLKRLMNPKNIIEFPLKVPWNIYRQIAANPRRVWP